MIGSGDGEKWLDSGLIWKAELIRFGEEQPQITTTNKQDLRPHSSISLTSGRLGCGCYLSSSLQSPWVGVLSSLPARKVALRGFWNLLRALTSKWRAH